MKVETYKNPTTEIALETNTSELTITPWATHEGATVVMYTKEGAVRYATGLRWEEWDLLVAAISMARVE